MRRWHVLLIAALVGVTSLLLVPFELLIARPMPPFALRALAIVQPAILTALAVWLGERTARCTGLRSPLVEAWLKGESPLAVLRGQAAPAMIAGLAVSLILVVYGSTVGKQLASHTRLASFDVPLISRVLYGGVTEELLMRWGLVSFLAWLGWRLMGRPDRMPAWLLATAIAMAALLFAVGHLPLVTAVAPAASAGVIVAVIAGNGVPGILFGVLFVRNGLEAAMLAHMSAHLLATMILAAL